MADLIKALEKQLTPTPEKIQSRKRLLPSQPANTPRERVYAGSDLGFIRWTGQKPRAGDVVVISGQGASLMVTTGQSSPPIRNPTFSGIPCVCKCPSNEGLAVCSTTCRDTVNLIAINVLDGSILQFFGTNELGTLGGQVNINGFTSFQSVAVAIDPDSPYDLWVVDDRRFWLTRRLDSAPVSTRGYFTLVRYVITGGQYVATSYVNLTDPGTTGGVPNDPPALETNFLSVLNGLPVISMQNSPARYMSINGATITTHQLLRNGSPYTRGLRGNIVTVPQAPARSNRHYVMATDGSAFELIEFADDDVITRVLAVTGLSFPYHLAAFCNRILILNGSIDEAVA